MMMSNIFNCCFCSSGDIMHAIIILLSICLMVHQENAAASTFTKKYFYIYDWPKKLRDVYPPQNATLHNTTSYHHDFGKNDGFGRTISRELGVFETWQFSLFKNIMARLRVSEHRTLDSTEASTFIIPYDMGVNSFIGESKAEVDGIYCCSCVSGAFWYCHNKIFCLCLLNNDCDDA
jgi:hypothetical protein